MANMSRGRSPGSKIGTPGTGGAVGGGGSRGRTPAMLGSRGRTVGSRQAAPTGQHHVPSGSPPRRAANSSAGNASRSKVNTASKSTPAVGARNTQTPGRADVLSVNVDQSASMRSSGGLSHGSPLRLVVGPRRHQPDWEADECGRNGDAATAATDLAASRARSAAGHSRTALRRFADGLLAGLSQHLARVRPGAGLRPLRPRVGEERAAAAGRVAAAAVGDHEARAKHLPAEPRARAHCGARRGALCAHEPFWRWDGMTVRRTRDTCVYVSRCERKP